MKIPKRFKLFGQTIEVEINKDFEDGNFCQGLAAFNKNRIIIQCGKAMKRPNTRTEQVYWHEAVHFIFNELGYSKEKYDEQMVDQIASALHQVITTSEYK